MDKSNPMIQTGPNTFVFAKELDTVLLNELYENDWEYAETVFEDCLKHLPDYFLDIEKAYKSGDISDLRRAVHKCKTLMGFVGLSSVQEIYHSFEKSCETAKEIVQLETSYYTLMEETRSGTLVVMNELQRLKFFNESQT